MGREIRQCGSGLFVGCNRHSRITRATGDTAIRVLLAESGGRLGADSEAMLREDSEHRVLAWTLCLMGNHTFAGVSPSWIQLPAT